jgi:hypothetical protein
MVAEQGINVTDYIAERNVVKLNLKEKESFEFSVETKSLSSLTENLKLLFVLYCAPM